MFIIAAQGWKDDSVKTRDKESAKEGIDFWKKSKNVSFSGRDLIQAVIENAKQKRV